MREIKFRAWNTKAHIYWPPSSMDAFSFRLFREPGNYILEQFSGLCDDSGREIYEGDIVYLAGYGNSLAEWPFVQLYESSWENDIGDIKGNIHENPELLK